MPYDEHVSNFLGSQPGRKRLPYRQSMNRGGGSSKGTLLMPPPNLERPSPYGQGGGQQYRPVNAPLDSQTNATGVFSASELGESLASPPASLDGLGPEAQPQMGAFGRERREADPVLKTLRAAYDSLEREKQRRRELDAVGAYQFEGSPIPGVGRGYAMPGVEGRAARHAARVRQELDLQKALDQGLSYEQAHRAAANTGQLEIHNDAMNYRNFQRDRMPGQMRTNAYRGIGAQGGQNADLASNLFGNIDANNAQQTEGYLGGGLDTPILDRDPVTGMMSPSQSGITKGDLMGSRGRFYAEREAGREAARQQVDASRQNMIDNLTSRQRAAGLPSYGTPLNAVGVDQEPRSTSTVRWTGNGFQLDGGDDGRARAAQQHQERLETLQRRREEIGEEMGLDGPANSMDVKINSRRKRSDILKQRNRAKFLARNPGRKYPGGAGAADSELTEAQQESQALAELMTQDFEALLGADNANPEAIGENFVGRLESMRGTLDNKDYERMLKWGKARGLIPEGYKPKTAEEVQKAEERQRRLAELNTPEVRAKNREQERKAYSQIHDPNVQFLE